MARKSSCKQFLKFREEELFFGGISRGIVILRLTLDSKSLTIFTQFNLYKAKKDSGLVSGALTSR